MRRALSAQRRRLASGTSVLAAAVAALSLGSAPAQGSRVVLKDGNSIANCSTETVDGMTDWVVDGVDHMYQQWFWFRVGDNGPESSIDDPGQTPIAVTDTNPFDGPAPDTLSVRYGDPTAGRLTIRATFSLAGGAL